MEYLSGCIADFYLKKGIINEDEKTVYEYATNLVLNEMFTFIIIILISGCCFRINYALEFLATFCLTRIYCGGFHANTVFVCRSTMFTTFILIIKTSFLLINIKFKVYLIIISLGLLILLPIIPVKHRYKSLNEYQIRMNRISGIVMYLLFAVISCLMWHWELRRDGIIVGLSLIAVSVLAIVGYFMEGRDRHE